MAKFTDNEMRELRELEASGAITVKKHPTEDLYLYSYTRDYVRSPNEQRWRNRLLNQCRGLITDGEGNIVARPFGKFFNYEELEKYYEPGEVDSLIAGKTPQFWEKIDGSLGILYWKSDGIPALCTRNSWVSDQAIRGTEMLNRHPFYADYIPQLRRDRTYLFEIVYPENRLIVDYGSDEMLYLLAVIDTETGMEYGFGPSFASDRGVNPGFPVPMQYDVGKNDWRKCREVFRNHDNREGFVVRFVDKPCFGNVFRVKMKFKEYFELNFTKGKITKQNLLKILCGPRPDQELAELRANLESAATSGAEEMTIQLDRYLEELRELQLEVARKVVAAWKPLGIFQNKLEWATYMKDTGFSKILFRCSKEEQPTVESLVWDVTISRQLWQEVKLPEGEA